MPIIADLQSLSHDTEIGLFRLTNYNTASPSESFYFTNHIGVQFAGRAYTPVPCEISGLEITSEGALPRPQLTIADIEASEGIGSYLITSLILTYGGLEGATLEYSSTLKRYLDGEASPDSTALRFYDSYTISQRIREIPGKVIEFELASSIDFVEESLPSRYCIRKCPWRYRGDECGYTGTKMFDLLNKPTTDPKKDKCAKTLTACTARFGRTAVLPFGGFPALLR